MPETEEKRSHFSDVSPIQDENRDLSRSSSKDRSLSRDFKRRTRISRITKRKITYGFDEVVGIKYDEACYRRPKKLPKTFANTYQLEPKKRFDCDKVVGIINKILEDVFEDHVYNPEISPALAIRIASDTRRRVKQENYDRCRLISIVTIGQNLAQSYNNAIAFLWDPIRDHYVNVNKKIVNGFVQVSLFAVYLD